LISIDGRTQPAAEFTSLRVPGYQLACPSSGFAVVIAYDDRAGLSAVCHAVWSQ
jgi:hypothetical protein